MLHQRTRVNIKQTERLACITLHKGIRLQYPHKSGTESVHRVTYGTFFWWDRLSICSEGHVWVFVLVIAPFLWNSFVTLKSSGAWIGEGNDSMEAESQWTDVMQVDPVAWPEGCHDLHWRASNGIASVETAGEWVMYLTDLICWGEYGVMYDSGCFRDGSWVEPKEYYHVTVMCDIFRV